MDYVLGIDGAQTRTRVLIAREDGEIIGWSGAGSANHLSEPGLGNNLGKP